MRIITFVFAVILVILSFSLAFRYNQMSIQAQEKLNKERYLKIEAEDRLQQAESKVNSMEGELARTTKKLTLVEKKLEQVEHINKDLKGRLDKATLLKDALDKQIADLQALVGVKPKSEDTP